MQIATSAAVGMSFFDPSREFSPRKYLVDTDWVVHYLRAKRTDIVARLQEIAPQGIGLSSISLAELYYGAYHSKRVRENLGGLKDFLSMVTILDIDEQIAQRFGQEKAKLQSRSIGIDNFDLLIGCTALVHQLIVLTNNRKDYERIEGLQIESM